MNDHCRYPRCRSDDIDVVYLSKALCSRHWALVASEDWKEANEALELLKLPTRTPYKPPVMKEPEPEEEPIDVCALCNKPVGPSSNCIGCDYYVCKGCDSMQPRGQHELEHHQQSGAL